MKRKKSLLKRILARKKLLAIMLILVVGWIGYQTFVVRAQKVAVETARVEKGEVKEELVLSGEISADEYAKLTFPTSGKVIWVGVVEGAEVKKGQALSKLDTTVLNTAFQQARSALRAAEATVEKVHDQVKDHSSDETFIQKDTRTTAEAAKDEAYEAYIAAEYNLRNSTLTSPFAGIITYLAHPYSGVNVLSTETQVEVINPSTIYFDVSADQNEVVDLYIGQKVSIFLDSMPDRKLEGEVVFVSFTPKSGEAGTVYKIKVKLLSDDLDVMKFRIGMSGDAKFVLSQKDGVLFAPPRFIKSDRNGKYVQLGRKNNKIYIETGLEGEDRIEVIGDVKEGDTLYD